MSIRQSPWASATGLAVLAIVTIVLVAMALNRTAPHSDPSQIGATPAPPPVTQPAPASTPEPTPDDSEQAPRNDESPGNDETPSDDRTPGNSESPGPGSSSSPRPSTEGNPSPGRESVLEPGGFCGTLGSRMRYAGEYYFCVDWEWVHEDDA
ncbi:hypothetical protein [Parenemella sanctibonifatiensis]|uniref:Uncharacterized protein n=1 Tax=Parenemella sanctibonifatiensis TaxID=2016505 RepID=A0A255ES62_9ACTN|nr:hypothetical protein [Parenemella sanctibonifatiensis]OYN92292.1 hypothetical protein CGZ91_01945 [Parenemella sanctibonifatiensis]